MIQKRATQCPRCGKTAKVCACTREEVRQVCMQRCRDQIERARIEANQAWKEQDLEGFALCRHSMGQAQRFLEKLEAES